MEFSPPDGTIVIGNTSQPDRQSNEQQGSASSSYFDNKKAASHAHSGTLDPAGDQSHSNRAIERERTFLRSFEPTRRTYRVSL